MGDPLFWGYAALFHVQKITIQTHVHIKHEYKIFDTETLQHSRTDWTKEKTGANINVLIRLNTKFTRTHIYELWNGLSPTVIWFIWFVGRVLIIRERKFVDTDALDLIFYGLATFWRLFK